MVMAEEARRKLNLSKVRWVSGAPETVFAGEKRKCEQKKTKMTQTKKLLARD